jgi:hypothetical protein
LADRLYKAGINEFINVHGCYVKLGIELGVARINDPPAAQAHDFQGRRHRDVVALAELAALTVPPRKAPFSLISITYQLRNFTAGTDKLR